MDVLPYPRFVARRSEQLELSLRELARRASSRGVVVNQSILSRAAGGTRSLPDTYPDRLDPVIALGERNGASRPIYVFGHIGHSGIFAPIFDGPTPEGRVGFMEWNTRKLARGIAEMLRGVPGWRSLHAAAAWPSWLVDRPALQLDERVIAMSPPELSEREVATLVAADVLAFLGAVAHNSDRAAAPRAQEASAVT
ncbi:MAG TPA: hypothetical protein VIM28_10960 [Solirubrobacterales bacterium]